MHFQKYFPRKGLTKLENHRKSDLIGDPAGADRPADRVCKGCARRCLFVLSGLLPRGAGRGLLGTARRGGGIVAALGDALADGLSSAAVCAAVGCLLRDRVLCAHPGEKARRGAGEGNRGDAGPSASETGIPARLRDVQVHRQDFSKIAQKALEDGALLVNPKAAGKQDILEILDNAY